MIRLTKQAKPPILARNEAQWTDEYERHRAGDPTVPTAAATRYRHADVKGAVTAESHGKCIYCESFPLATSPGAVEHLTPKSRFPSRVVEWQNLGFVCERCNTAKGDYHHDEEAVINPFVEEPQDFLIFAGPLVLDRNARGDVTIRTVALDRTELVESRAEHIRQLNRLRRLMAFLPEGPARDALRDDLARAGDEPSEFAAISRAYLRASDHPPIP